MSNLVLRASLAAAALGAAAASQAVVFADDFSVGQDAVTVDSVAGGAYNIKAVGAFDRFLGVRNLDNLAPGSARSRLAVNAGFLSVGNEPEVKSLQTVGYGFGAGSDLTGSVDLLIGVLSNDVAGSVHVDSDDADGHHYAASFAVPVGASTVKLANFLGGLDVKRITGISLAFDASDYGADLRVSGVQAVPEPASFAVLGLGAVALLRRRRRA